MRFRALISGTFLFVAAFASHCAAYSLYGAKWTTAGVTMQLQLGAGAGVLLDGASSWGAAAEDSLSIWNSYIGATKFSVVRDSTAARAAGNRLNNVYFSADVNGEAWGTGVLAVTLIYSSGASHVETDVLFNNRLSWNSYRGPLRTSSNGTPLYDFHRVALHEFGHALGLDHPDEDGQSVAALMNSRVSGLDALTADDIAGAQSLYGAGAPVVTPPTISVHPTSRSVAVGQSTTFNVIANSPTPMSYRWMKSGVTIPGATNAAFNIASVSPADAGAYSVVVSNATGSVTSAAALLSIREVVALPFISTGPADQTVPLGGRLRLSVIATGSSPLSYAWRKDGTPIPGAINSVYEIAAAERSDAGSYVVVVTGSAGSVTSAAARVTVSAASPTIVSGPTAQTATAGEDVTFSVVAEGSPPFAYQWFKDAQAIPGANSSTHALRSIRATDAGNYSVQVTNDAGSVTVSAALAVRSSRLVNLSTRAFVPAGGTLTPGFFLRGTGSKPVILRAVGPTLRLFGVEGAVPEARLELIAQGENVSLPADDRMQAVNDAAVSVGAFPLEPGGKDAAAQASLIARGYTVRVSPGTATMSGIALAEIYDADPATSASQLVNVSTLGFAGAGENGLTAGFVISGNAPKRLLIRGVGPGLAPFGVSGTLADPQIAVLRQGMTEPLVTNDNWGNEATVRNAFTTAGAFSLPVGSNDAALVVTLEPGAYTVLVSSVTAATTGQALVEIYDLDP